MEKITESNKRIAKNSVFLYIRMLVIMVVSLYTSRVILASLGVENFGIYNVVGGIVSLFAFINGAMSQTTQRYIAYELGYNNGINIKKVFSSCMLMHILIALIVLIFAETIGLYILNNYLIIPKDRLYAANWVYQFSIMSSIIMILSTPYNGAIVAYEHMKVFAYISLLDAVLRLLTAFIISYSIGDNLIFYAFLLFVVQLIIRGSYSLYCKRNMPAIRFNLDVDKKKFKSMLGFTSWTMFNNLSIIACTQGINLLLNVFFTPIVNAARGIAMQVELAVSSFSKDLQVAINPQIIKSYSIKDLDRYYSLIHASSKYSFFLFFIIAVPILLETDYILSLWLTIVPEYTIDFTRIIIIVSLINILVNPINVGVSATGKIKRFQIVSGILLISILPISFFVFKHYPNPILVFVVYLGMSLIVYGYKLYYAFKNIKLNLYFYFKQVLLRILGASTIAFFFSFMFKKVLIVKTFIELVFMSLSYVLICLSVIFLVGLNMNEKNKIRCLLKKILLLKK